MPYATSLSTSSDTRTAVSEVCAGVLEQLAGAVPNLCLLFVSQDHARGSFRVGQSVIEQTQTSCLLGCTAETVIGNDREVEEGSAVCLWAASIPSAKFEPFHARFQRTPDGIVCLGIPEAAANAPAPQAAFMLGDPFSCSLDAVISRLDDDFPGVPLLGGMASGGQGPGENQLYFNADRVEGGGIGVLMHGGPKIHSVVSQGCRQIGTTFLVTKAEQNVVFELGGRPALQRLQELFGSLPDKDRTLIRQGLHLGIAMNEYKDSFGRGDFLISNVLGADHESGAIAIGNLVRTGQTVQFHVRDAETADEDLRQMLGEWRQKSGATPAAALLFSCNGRGTRLFTDPNHDAAVLRELCGPVPVAGLFAQGELGPVGGKNYVHGYTASIAIFAE